MLHQEEELLNDSGRPLSYNSFTDKKQSGCFFFFSFIFCIELSLPLLLFKVQGLQMTINFALV